VGLIRERMRMQAVARELGRIAGGASFAVTRTLPASALDFSVKDVGPVTVPLTARGAEALRKVARPARYGLREKTVLDLSVRDAWEVPKSRIQMDEQAWQTRLEPELQRIHAALGLPAGTRLTAELHNLLIYGPGQFFAPHQDSEKSDSMIASLVVTLPSRFKGGALEIEHGGESLTSRGSPSKLTLTAFFADCFHRVKRVTDGYRVSLTYHLLLEGEAEPVGKPARVGPLVEAVRAFFATPITRSWRQEPDPPPERLVYLLDHQYTRASLRWEGLKQDDAPRAAALREVADQLDCELFLALADVHETWGCMDAQADLWRRRRRRSEWDDDHAHDQSPIIEGQRLTNLIDQDVQLRHFVKVVAGSTAPKAATLVAEEELCWTRASKDCEPFASEYEPYQGNWGNTVDRWYHRAAVVLWPRRLSFLLRARSSPKWALQQWTAMLRRGEEATARDYIHQLLPFWQRHRLGEEPHELLPRTFQVAAGLGDLALAQALLAPFVVDDLRPAAVGPWLKAMEACGRELGDDWLQHLAQGSRHGADFSSLSHLPAICDAFLEQATPSAEDLARSLCHSHWQRFLARVQQLIQRTPRLRLREEMEGLQAWWLVLLGSGVLLDDDALTGEIIAALQDPTRSGDLRHVADLVRLAGSEVPSLLQALQPVLTHLRAALSQRVAQPPRGSDDWSIEPPADCACELCRKLQRFLAAASQRKLEWPLAKERRQHIHRSLDHHALPVRHQTRREGRPFTLILEKTDRLFKLDRAERDAMEQALAWLEALDTSS